MSDKKRINAAIRKRFVEAVLSIPEDQQDVCKTIGLDPGNFSKIKNDLRFPPLYAIHNLQKHYGISAQLIIMGKPR